jgi:hypothetical protein
MNLGHELMLYLYETPRPSFSWGAFNCCHFGARWFERMEGTDLSKFISGLADLREVMRRVDELGGLVAGITQALARPTVSPALARIGDLVHIEGVGHFGAVGICNGVTAVFINENGDTEFQSMARATSAWHLQPAQD